MAIGVELVEDVDLNLAETAREGDLSCFRETLPGKDQELVAEQGFVDPAEERIVHRFRKIDATNLDADDRRQRLEPKRGVVVVRRCAHDLGFPRRRSPTR